MLWCQEDYFKMENKVKFEIIRQFGPSVFKTQIPNELLDKLNNYAEQIIKDKNSLTYKILKSLKKKAQIY